MAAELSECDLKMHRVTEERQVEYFVHGILLQKYLTIYPL